jgi:hypothetical protein
MAPETSLLDDLERLRLPEGQAVKSGRSARTRPPRHRTGERFLKGPIPWSWLARAARQPGKALHVAIAAWHQAAMARSATVPLSLSDLAGDLGVLRDAARRGLEALEAAGLVRVERCAGRRPLVTILDVSPGDGNGGA